MNPPIICIAYMYYRQSSYKFDYIYGRFLITKSLFDNGNCHLMVVYLGHSPTSLSE